MIQFSGGVSKRLFAATSRCGGAVAGLSWWMKGEARERAKRLSSDRRERAPRASAVLCGAERLQ
ncbi:hypothetical protein C450_10248 [Halococcus salifodinae DSM 8989]|uniref:Uncharacterized protein n=1 Tax=Halococcus salifodinae DSM 8989 TaxID=1227456 RepID=M0N3M6_9EURY|nr:hypothetical protein C450_10248 [Halococcus salifodinae DSM 8989]